MPGHASYLKPNARTEPLLRQWYAVSLAVPPASGAMFLANSQIPIMKSYVVSPETHVAASRDPSMIGGPFMNYAESRVPQIQALLDRTVERSRPILEFAEGIRALDQLLRREAKGFSLEPLYPQVPDALKGYVELNYDINHVPSFRLIERLLYRTPVYDRAAQSIGLSLMDCDDRPFVLSTPRLPGSDYLCLDIAFDDPRLDALFAMKRVPRPVDEIAELLQVGAADRGLFDTLFTQTPPAPRADAGFDEDGVRVRYFGHACLLIETRQTSILTDPMISYEYDSGIARQTFADLPETIDYVIITHSHLDHVVLESLLQLRHKVRSVVVPRNNRGVLADPSLRLLLSHLGFRNVIGLDEFESVAFEDGSLTALPFLGEHHDLNLHSRVKYLVRARDRSIVVAADACNLETQLYRHLHAEYGDIDALFLGMECDGAPPSWFYGPLMLRKQSREMDYSRQGSACNYPRAIELADSLRCKRAYVYAMGLEPWLSYIMSINWTADSLQITESDRFLAGCRERGVEAERLFGQRTLHL
ncbi:MBL fold metallo-hydrolase [Lysobacter enzymogenes]|uniref:MBL fold metallo-hydrolase n=1 Tax=Lysobacter enzymogenes TaxID=69 RepID=UPI00099CC9D1|nr:MBL fold metallo-hydrolase [Lysobacter enzymogenes]UZW58361.1 MBL fold metallo-hydrolase [Lysobacter enzymogenes]